MGNLSGQIGDCLGGEGERKRREVASTKNTEKERSVSLLSCVSSSSSQLPFPTERSDRDPVSFYGRGGNRFLSCCPRIKFNHSLLSLTGRQMHSSVWVYREPIPARPANFIVRMDQKREKNLPRQNFIDVLLPPQVTNSDQLVKC